MSVATVPIEVVIEDAAFLVSWGVGMSDAARRLGTTPHGLERRLLRAGRRDLVHLLLQHEPLQIGETGGARAARAARAERRAS
ncbi:hypothetical protein [Actinotalea sp. JY-7876]|uniref:hypothetical protein n=1 Tax=Actinotalea sp. JY-7876 TaxID=2758442 RepID=UPI001C714B31|nr:hypothetical protein [Actinotalea sp. JY-7876]